MPKQIDWRLLAGDIAAFLVFGLVGLTSHEESISASILARSMLPFPLAWIAVSPWFGAVDHDWPSSPGKWRRLLVAWLTSGTIALLARSLIFDRELLNAFFVIALRSGFCSQSHFTAAFRQAYGVTPGRYAAEHRKKESLS